MHAQSRCRRPRRPSVPPSINLPQFGGSKLPILSYRPRTADPYYSSEAVRGRGCRRVPQRREPSQPLPLPERLGGTDIVTSSGHHSQRCCFRHTDRPTHTHTRTCSVAAEHVDVDALPLANEREHAKLDVAVKHNLRGVSTMVLTLFSLWNTKVTELAVVVSGPHAAEHVPVNSSGSKREAIPIKNHDVQSLIRWIHVPYPGGFQTGARS